MQRRRHEASAIAARARREALVAPCGAGVLLMGVPELVALVNDARTAVDVEMMTGLR
jgi:hypothetical protein